MTTTFQLRVERGAQRGQLFDLTSLSGRWTMGSDATAEIRLQGKGIAPKHAELGRLKDGSLGVRILAPASASMNGTAIESARWSVGEQLEIGEACLVLIEVPSAPPKPPIEKPAAERAAASSETDPLVGQEFGGYRILAHLGRGGMGTVYRALQISLHREVALKLLSPELCAEPGFVQQFQAEARAAGQLNHPNIVQVYDVGQDGARHFYSMELIPHGSLEVKLKQEGQLTWQAALKAALDAARGLEYAESKGIVHRDIKPDNLMLGERGVVKIADLGLAGRHEEDPRERGVLGTPHFMSPEQAQGLPVDARGDIYSLGATLYRILSGRTPFSGRSVKEIIRAQVQDDATPLIEVDDSIPQRVSDLVGRMMRKDPAERFASASGVITEIQVALAEDGQVARGGLPKGALVAIGLVVIGVGAWLVFGQKSDPDRNSQGSSDPKSRTDSGGDATSGTGLSNSSNSNAGQNGNAGESTTDPNQPSAAELEMRKKLRDANAQLAFTRAEATTGTRKERAEAWRGVATEFADTAAGKLAGERVRTLEAEEAALVSAIAAMERGDAVAMERRDWAAALKAIAEPVQGLHETLREDSALLAAANTALAAIAERAESTTRQSLMNLATPQSSEQLAAARTMLDQLDSEVSFDEAFRSALPEAIAKRFDLLRLAVVQRREALDTEAQALRAANRDAERIAVWRALGAPGAASDLITKHEYARAGQVLEDLLKSISDPELIAICKARREELRLAEEASSTLSTWLLTTDRKPLQIEDPEGRGKVNVERMEGNQLFVQKRREEASRGIPLETMDTAAECMALYEPLLQGADQQLVHAAALLVLQTTTRNAVLAREAIAAVLKGEEEAGKAAASWFKEGFDGAEQALNRAPESPSKSVAAALLVRERESANELCVALQSIATGRLSTADGALERLQEIGRASWLFAILSEGRGSLVEDPR